MLTKTQESLHEAVKKTLTGVISAEFEKPMVISLYGRVPVEHCQDDWHLYEAYTQKGVLGGEIICHGKIHHYSGEYTVLVMPKDGDDGTIKIPSLEIDVSDYPGEGRTLTLTSDGRWRTKT